MLAIFGLASATIPASAASAPVVDIPVGSNPIATVLSLDGSILFVATAGPSGAGSITVVGVSTPSAPSVISTVSLNALVGHATSPSALALSANGTMLYVADALTNNLYALNIIAPTSMSLSWVMAVGAKPTGIAVSPYTNRLVVTNEADASMSILAVSPSTGGSLVATITLPSAQLGSGIRALSPVFITPQSEIAVGGEVVAVTDGYRSVWLINTLYVDETPTGYWAGINPISLAFDEALGVLYASSQGGVREIYLANFSGEQLYGFPDNSLWSIALAPNASLLANTNSSGGSALFHPVGPPFPGSWQQGVGLQPTQTTFSPDSLTAYIANTGSADVSVVSLTSSWLQSVTPAALVQTSAVSAPLRTSISSRRVVLRHPDVAKTLSILRGCEAKCARKPLKTTAPLPITVFTRN